MKNFVIVEHDRINSFGIAPSFTKDGNEVKWCLLPQEAYRFLVVQGVLIIGAVLDHSALYAVWEVRDEPNETVKSSIREVARVRRESRDHGVVAAGVIGCDGKVTGWGSEGFQVNTPIHMRSEIHKVIRELFQNGVLSPRR